MVLCFFIFHKYVAIKTRNPLKLVFTKTNFATEIIKTNFIQITHSFYKRPGLFNQIFYFLSTFYINVSKTCFSEVSLSLKNISFHIRSSNIQFINIF